MPLPPPTPAGAPAPLWLELHRPGVARDARGTATPEPAPASLAPAACIPRAVAAGRQLLACDAAARAVGLAPGMGVAAASPFLALLGKKGRKNE